MAKVLPLVCLGVFTPLPFCQMENCLTQSKPFGSYYKQSRYRIQFNRNITQRSNHSSLFKIPWWIIGYLSVTAILFTIFLIRLFSLWKLKNKASIQYIDNTKIWVTDKNISPFSFFNLIMINRETLESPHLPMILQHEKTHVSQWHSLDVIFAELICIVFFYNPLVYLLKKEIRINLEYLADNNCKQTQNYKNKSYQYAILQMAINQPHINISNYFNYSPIKQRIMMLNKKNSGKSAMLKYLSIAPIMLVLMLLAQSKELFALNKKTQTANETILSIPPTDNEIITTTSDSVFNFTTVDEKPIFPGGDSALVNFLGENIKYPEHCKEQKIGGRVYVQFVINKKGKVSDIKVPRGVHPDLDKEAVRAVSLLPDWTPGKYQGKAVPVVYVVPINFKLQTDEEIGEQAVTDSLYDYTSIDEQPIFPGGESALFKYIARNTRYPETCKEKGIGGRVFVQFIINKTGKVSNVEVLRSVHPELDQEAMRVISSLPDWTPGKHQGKNVSVQYTIPISFKSY